MSRIIGDFPGAAFYQDGLDETSQNKASARIYDGASTAHRGTLAAGPLIHGSEYEYVYILVVEDNQCG